MKRALVLGGVLAALAAAPVSAQTEFSVNADLFSSYVWRGITLTSKPVLQPDVSLSFPIGKASLTFGGWANVELGEYDDADDITQGGGSAFNLAEFDPYAEIGYTIGKATVAWGVVGYLFPNDAPAIDSDFNTWEAYGTVSVDAPLAPSAAVYYDFDKVKGLYFEGSIGHGIPLGTTTLNLGALVGLNAGQEVNDDDPDQLANFADAGLTHVDLSASVDLSAGAFTISPVVHFQINSDDATKYNDNKNFDDDFKLWGGFSISWSRTFGGSSEE